MQALVDAFLRWELDGSPDDEAGLDERQDKHAPITVIDVFGEQQKPRQELMLMQQQRNSKCRWLSGPLRASPLRSCGTG